MDTLLKIELGASQDFSRKDREMMERSSHTFISKDVPSPDVRSIPWKNLTEAQKIAWSKHFLAGIPPKADERSPSSINLRNLTNTQRDKVLEEAGRSYGEDDFSLPNLLEGGKPRTRLEIQAKVRNINGDEFAIPYIRLKSLYERKTDYSSSRKHGKESGKRIESRGKSRARSFAQKAALLIGVPLTIYLISHTAIRAKATQEIISPVPTTEYVQEIKQSETQKLIAKGPEEATTITIVKEEKRETQTERKEETPTPSPSKAETSSFQKEQNERIVIPDSQTGEEKALPKRVSDVITNAFGDIGKKEDAARVLHHPKEITGLWYEKEAGYNTHQNYGENASFKTGKDIDIPNNDATSTEPASIDRGLYRINSRTFEDMAKNPYWSQRMREYGVTKWDDMLDAQKNAYQARLIYERQGWKSWFAAPKDLRSEPKLSDNQEKPAEREEEFSLKTDKHENRTRGSSRVNTDDS
ncbi:MAG TPA: hypothetical protein VJ179_00105 [Patescibacteria group bacterium]|nr:hypothetical protein [Patescibacteria group bacterium]